jgi:hypothetical protein
LVRGLWPRHSSSAFIQLTVAGNVVGATWIRFTATEALAEGYSSADGRI